MDISVDRHADCLGPFDSSLWLLALDGQVDPIQLQALDGLGCMQSVLRSATLEWLTILLGRY